MDVRELVQEIPLDTKAQGVLFLRRVSPVSVISRESLSESLTATSSQRVDAVREEYPELVEILDALRGLPSIGALEDLEQRLTTVGNAERSADAAIGRLVDAGVVAVQEGQYFVPDLYRHGLQMRRQGPR